MKVLGIDSSGMVASVAVVEDTQMLAEYTINYKKTHSQTLLPMLDEIGKMIELDLSTVDAIAVAAGPGSFTGLRIGSATAKGLGLALKKPLVSVPTLEGIAYNFCVSDKLVCPMMDARRSQVYTGIYKFSGNELEKVEDQMAVPVEEILAKLKEGAGQMPVSDKNNMEAGKTDSGTLEGAEKELEQLYYEWKTPTDIRGMEPMHQAFAAITAVQLWRWRQSRQFCGRCGAKTEDSKIERALVCPVCGQTEYPKISPAVIVAITNGDKLLMSRYRVNHSTYRGYALIAGFVEIGETFEETVRREVMEEVGLKVKNIRYFKSQPWAFTDTEMIGFFAELDGDDKIRLQEDELSEAGWYTREEIPDDARLISVGTEMKMYFKYGPDWEKKWQEHQK